MKNAMKALQEISRKQKEEGEPYSPELLERVSEIIRNLPIEPEVSLLGDDFIQLEYYYNNYEYLGIDVFENGKIVMTWDSYDVKDGLIEAEEINDIVLEFHGENRIATIKKLTGNPTEEECLEEVRSSPELLRFIENQSERICLEAVRNDRYGNALKFVREQTPEICMEAVKRSGSALMYVKEQTPEICLRAILTHPGSLAYVQNPTSLLCELAMKRDKMLLLHVPEEIQTLEMCLSAVEYSSYNLRGVSPRFRKECEEYLASKEKDR